MEKEERYWIAVASKDHVQTGLDGGFAQANHGKRSPMKQLSKGDKLVYYSSKKEYGNPEPYRKFTAVGEVVDDELYEGIMSEGFRPYRRAIRYYPAREVAIQPLLEDLTFIENPKKWGYPFRRGFFEISRQDYRTITQPMLHEVESH